GRTITSGCGSPAGCMSAGLSTAEISFAAQSAPARFRTQPLYQFARPVIVARPFICPPPLPRTFRHNCLTPLRPTCYNGRNNRICNDCEQNEYLPQRGSREPAVVEAGFSAGSEWIWESRTEQALASVDCAGLLHR